MGAELYRPPDDQYWVRNWSSVLFAGDLFAAIPFADQPFEATVGAGGHDKHFVGPVAFGFGLLVSPTCDMFDQKTGRAAHPYRGSRACSSLLACRRRFLGHGPQP